MNIPFLLKIYANRSKTPLQLKYLYNLGKNKSLNYKLYQTKFLHNELSVRLSHRVMDLIKLPYGIPKIPEIRSVIDLYINSFEKIQLINTPKSIEDIKFFNDTVENIKRNHDNLEKTIACGLSNVKDPLVDYTIINQELSKFFISRIGIRTLISQQIDTIKYNKNIFSLCNFKTIILNSIKNLDYISDYLYNDTPDVILNCESDINIPYISSHLEYIFTEILKNAFVAQNKFNILDSIIIDVSEGESDIIIRISDKGKGFKYSEINKTMSFSYSTSNIDINNVCDRDLIISGYGFGLPMSKLYAQYFGGNLFINPIENVGTDVFIYINKLGKNLEKVY